MTFLWKSSIMLMLCCQLLYVQDTSLQYKISLWNVFSFISFPCRTKPQGLEWASWYYNCHGLVHHLHWCFWHIPGQFYNISVVFNNLPTIEVAFMIDSWQCDQRETSNGGLESLSWHQKNHSAWVSWCNSGVENLYRPLSHFDIHA